ncbi:MAG: phage tail assembly chaperone [Litoreibacter sp.]
MDWPALMRVGIGQRGLHPSEFWALTPIELMLMLGLDAREKPLNRARLAELERSFVTVQEGKNDGI